MALHSMKVQNLHTFQSPGNCPGQEDYLLNDLEKGIFVVADGFGGPALGSAVSRTACEAVKNFLFKEAGDLEATLPFVLRSYFSLVGNVLFNALVHANRKVCVQNKGKNIDQRGGASILAGYLDGEILALANVGCCSAWLFRNGEVSELVMPRSYTRVIDPFGRVSRAGLRVPMMALGISEDLEPEISEYRVQKGDFLLLSTDGILDELDSVLENLRKIQWAGLTIAERNQQAELLFKSKKFNDNISLSLVIL